MPSPGIRGRLRPREVRGALPSGRGVWGGFAPPRGRRWLWGTAKPPRGEGPPSNRLPKGAGAPSNRIAKGGNLLPKGGAGQRPKNDFFLN